MLARVKATVKCTRDSIEGRPGFCLGLVVMETTSSQTGSLENRYSSKKTKKTKTKPKLQHGLIFMKMTGSFKDFFSIN